MYEDRELSKDDPRVKSVIDEGIDVERPVETHEGFTFGDRVHLIEEDEDCTLVIEIVGGAEYDNERIALFVIPDGTDMPIEAPAWNIEANAQ